jgi:uncharacterized protein YifN (PemK superfamily)
MADLKKPENILELIQFQRNLLKKYYCYINRLIKENYKHAALLTYWLRDYLQYLKSEATFNPKFNMNYQRGQIVYINFGYRIGSEIGGCHYAIVLDVKSSKTNSQLTVIPMKSKRTKVTHYSSIYHVDLYDEVRSLLLQKSIDIITSELPKINAIIKTYDLQDIKANSTIADQLSISKHRLNHAQQIHDFADKKLNHESVADIGQICTISKIRIVHPLKKHDVLTGVCLSPSAMQRIEQKLHQLFFSDII